VFKIRSKWYSCVVVDTEREFLIGSVESPIADVGVSGKVVEDREVLDYSSNCLSYF